MSDSDDDLMPESLLKYQHGMHAQRPNINNTHITSFSVRNHNMMTSTFNMPNYERQKYGAGFDQRRMCYRRETSPMSLRSFPDSGMQNFNSYYPRAMSSQRSVFNGRSGSPMSIRSIDSNASVSAADIALAFKNVKFNKYDLRLIKEAYNKFLKNRVRKRIEKRRNLKLFLKNTKRESGEDSGAQGSDSSISSDDCRSTRTAIYKENLPVSRPRPIRTDITSIRTTIKDSNMYEDCTENIKQNTLRNILAVNDQVHVKPANTINSKPQNGTQFTLKDRFAKRNAFVLPSQRFNKTGTKTKTKIIDKQTNPANNDKITRINNIESVSENEEIFSEVTVRENVQESTSLERKRNLEIEESNNMSTKRKKLTNSPLKCNNESLVSSTLINTHNDFTFKKPEMPVRRSVKAKDIIFTDKLISKSAQPMVDDFDLDFSLNRNKQVKNNKDTNTSTQQISQNTSETVNTNNETEILQNTTDVSLRPSFIKRKLFSQKLDVLDKKNLSIENQDSNSPQPKLYAGEKHKVRKLVTSQSCLNRDIIDDNNVLDLIHKIVPPDQMNMTNAKNKKCNKKSQDDDKWDVTSVISMCDNGDISETYTDEEIFKVDGKSKSNAKKNSDANNKKDKKSTANKHINKKCNNTPTTKDVTKFKVSPCRIVVEKLQPALINSMEIYNQNQTLPNQSKRTVSSCVRSFWDTDFESDMEERPQFPLNKLADGKSHHNKHVANNTLNLTKRNGIKGEILTVRCSQNKGINSSVRSDISKVSQKKNLNKIDENKEPVVIEKCTKNSQANINSSLIEVKTKKGRQKSIKNNLTPARKVDTKNKETNKRKNEVNNTKKNPNKTRILTPRKVNEKKHQSSPKSNQSSFNCSNISSRSLRSSSRSLRSSSRSLRSSSRTRRI